MTSKINLAAIIKPLAGNYFFPLVTFFALFCAPKPAFAGFGDEYGCLPLSPLAAFRLNPFHMVAATGLLLLAARLIARRSLLVAR